MATFDSKEIIDQMIANDGVYPGDPQALEICGIKAWGKQTYHVAWSEAEMQRLRESPYVSDIKVLWSKGGEQ